MNIDNKNWKAVIWGHKLHSHTHSYIHNAFYRTFKHMGFETLWLDDKDNVENIDFDNSFFITEGQVDNNIPINESCFYILHNCPSPKYKDLYLKNRCMALQVYVDVVLTYNLFKIEDCMYFDKPGKCIYMPWATDLLPDEIEKNKPSIAFNNESKTSAWIGTIGGGKFGNIEQISPFKTACEEKGITFSCSHMKSVEENITLIKNSYLAPTIVGKWQHEVGYIPCRIFKNISYGQFGLTNSPRVAGLFKGKITHNNDTHQLFYDARERLNNMSLSELYELIDFVKNNHTYINRINMLIEHANKII